MTDGDFTSTGRPISRLSWPTQEQLLAARRERGLLLRAMIVSAARTVARAFTKRRRHESGLTTKSPPRRPAQGAA